LGISTSKRFNADILYSHSRGLLFQRPGILEQVLLDCRVFSTKLAAASCFHVVVATLTLGNPPEGPETGNL
jgi:hypothetical protein